MKHATAAFLAFFLFMTSVSSFSAETPEVKHGNPELIRMLKAGFTEAQLIEVVRASPGSVDRSVDALLELKRAGATPALIDAVLEPRGSAQPRWVPPGTKTKAYVMAVVAENTIRIEGVAAKAVESGNQGMTLAAIAADGAFQGAALAAAGGVAAQAGRFMPGVVGAVASVALPFVHLGHRTKVTLVFTLPGSHATTTVAPNAHFKATYNDLVGIDPDAWRPAVIKLEATPKNLRVVYAAKVPQAAMVGGISQTPCVWEFVEDEVPMTLTSLGRGEAELTPEAPLAAGEYAVVLRPKDPKQQVGYADVLRGVDEGVAVRPVWEFSVPESLPR